jgi:hypothetical protein
VKPTPVRAWFVLIAVSGCWLAAAGQQPPLPGSLDLTFGSNGWTIVDFDTLGDEPFGLAVLGDGSILVGGEVTTRATGSGDFGILKLTATGRPILRLVRRVWPRWISNKAAARSGETCTSMLRAESRFQAYISTRSPPREHCHPGGWTARSVRMDS